MFESNELLPTLSYVLEQAESCGSESNPEQAALNPGLSGKKAQQKAEREWYGAIAALEQLLLKRATAKESDSCLGLILSAPAPILSQRSLLSCFHTGIFTPEAFNVTLMRQLQLPAAEEKAVRPTPSSMMEYPLIPIDPLAAEQFCLVLTAEFSLVMVLGENIHNIPTFQFSFDPAAIAAAWETLRSRLILTSPHQVQPLDDLVAQFAPKAPDYRLVSEFTRQLLKGLPELSHGSFKAPVTNNVCNSFNSAENEVLSLSEERSESSLPELELLQALTHEIRTPLTTIRMLTRLLLKQRRKLAADAIDRLETIDRECTEQIERMELIFRAAELETTPIKQETVHLVPISLEQVIQQNISHWQKQAQRRNVTLDIVLPEKLPTVVSDAAMLDRVLKGLVESFTRSLPTGSHVRVQVTTAGHQLKLQLLSHNASMPNSLKALGQLLVFQPETGGLGLNWEVTKNLFNALGGKLILRQRPPQGEELTIFLPLGTSQSERQREIFNKQPFHSC